MPRIRLRYLSVLNGVRLKYLEVSADKFHMDQDLRVIQSYKFQKVNKGPTKVLFPPSLKINDFYRPAK
jgi:hypothetical protein